MCQPTWKTRCRPRPEYMIKRQCSRQIVTHSVKNTLWDILWCCLGGRWFCNRWPIGLHCVSRLLVTWCQSLYSAGNTSIVLPSDSGCLPILHATAPETKLGYCRHHHIYFLTFCSLPGIKDSHKMWLYRYVIILSILKSALWCDKQALHNSCFATTVNHTKERSKLDMITSSQTRSCTRPILYWRPHTASICKSNIPDAPLMHHPSMASPVDFSMKLCHLPSTVTLHLPQTDIDRTHCR